MYAAIFLILHSPSANIFSFSSFLVNRPCPDSFLIPYLYTPIFSFLLFMISLLLWLAFFDFMIEALLYRLARNRNCLFLPIHIFDSKYIFLSLISSFSVLYCKIIVALSLHDIFHSNSNNKNCSSDTNAVSHDRFYLYCPENKQ